MNKPELQIPPVDLDRIVNHLGITLEESDLGENAGLLIRRDSETLICLNWLHSDTQHRFTLAHELGHYLLHTSLGYMDQNTYAHHPKGSTGTPREERQAHQFALALLIPEAWIRELLKQKPLDLGSDRELIDLAKQFRVGLTAIAHRLAQLGLLRL